MNDDRNKSLDRAILDENTAGWVSDRQLFLESVDLELIMTHFEPFEIKDKPRLLNALRQTFHEFVNQVLFERYHKNGAVLERSRKPSTIAVDELAKLMSALGTMENALNKLDPAAAAFVDIYLESNKVTGEVGQRMTYKSLIEPFFWPLDQLVRAAQLAQDQPSKTGPANMAQRGMIERLANWWEVCSGEVPRSDKGRGRHEDPFLELCREMTQIGRRKLKSVGADVGTVSLSGLVAGVLQEMRDTKA